MAKILLVDDEEPLRTLLRLLLHGYGHEVVEAGSGAHALKLFEQQPADLVICDLFMPDMDGIEVTRELRRRGSTVPIIVTTGGSSDNFAEALLAAAQALGATMVLPKPFERDLLRAAVTAALRTTG